MMVLSIMFISNFVHYEAWADNTINNKEHFESINGVLLKKYIHVCLYRKGYGEK